MEGVGKELNIKVLITLYEENSRFNSEIIKDVEQHFRNELFETKVHNSLELRESASLGMPITEYSQDSTGFKDYKRLAKELIQKVENVRGQLNDDMARTYSGVNPSC